MIPVAAEVSRVQVQADRLRALTPTYLAMLQRQLARFFTWRDLARHDVTEAMVGQQIADVIPLNTKGDRWRVASASVGHQYRPRICGRLA